MRIETLQQVRIPTGQAIRIPVSIFPRTLDLPDFPTDPFPEWNVSSIGYEPCFIPTTVTGAIDIYGRHPGLGIALVSAFDRKTDDLAYAAIVVLVGPRES